MQTRLSELSDHAAEDIRSILHLLPQELGEPSEVYDLVGNFRLIAQMIPQALDAMGAWLEDQQQAGKLRNVGGLNARAQGEGITDGLTVARVLACGLGNALDDVYQDLSSLGSK